jgi:hypothetical protein
MLEKECIQSRGFENVTSNGEVVGFQVAFRSLYYRGVWLSQLRPATVIVDGETFSGNEVTWTIGGKTYQQAELAGYGDIHWSMLEPAVLTVKKPGGLAQGFHDVEIKYAYSSSYLPPVLDEAMVQWSGPMKRRLILV